MIAPASAFLWQHPWAGIALAAASFGALVAALKWYAFGATAHRDAAKTAARGLGLLTLPFPFLFADVWPVLLLTGSTAVFLAAVKFLPPGRRRFGGILPASANDIRRVVLSPRRSRWSSGCPATSTIMFVVPVLVLSIADAGSAVMGSGMAPSATAARTRPSSSLAFAVVAFVYVLVVWHPSTGAGHPSTGSGRGRTNRSRPDRRNAGPRCHPDRRRRPARARQSLHSGWTYFILAALLDLDILGLQLWLVLVVALVGLIVMRLGSTERNVRHPAARICVGWPAGGADVRRKKSCA